MSLRQCARGGIAKCAAVSVSLITACADTGSPAAPTLPIVERINFHRDVAPILERHCQRCHTAGGLAPFALESYGDVRRMLPAIRAETAARRMPPWGAHDTAECRPRLPWREDRRLTDAEIETFAVWEREGALEGRPTAAAASLSRDVPQVGQLAGMTGEVEGPRFEVEGTGDTFPCFAIDPHLPDGTLLGGLQLVPSNPGILHHAEIWAQDGVSEEICATGAKSTLLHFFLPNNGPLDLPDDIAMRLPPNARFVIGAHYSPGGQAQVDVPRIQFRVAHKTPKYVIQTVKGFQLNELPPAADGTKREFKIPAGERHYVAETEIAVPESLEGARIYSVAAHQHLAGVDMKINLLQPAGGGREADAQCLLQDRWDFHWQQAYTYEAPIDRLPVLHAGDRVAMRCTYDNSMNSRRLGPEYRKRGLPPMDISLGQGTLDEMCLFLPRIVLPYDGAR
jgi:hypothetical protein